MTQNEDDDLNRRISEMREPFASLPPVWNGTSSPRGAWWMLNPNEWIPREWGHDQNWPALLREMIEEGKRGHPLEDIAGFELDAGKDGVAIFEPGYEQGLQFENDEDISEIVRVAWLRWKENHHDKNNNANG